MGDWEDKSFKVLAPVKERFDTLMSRKGEQMVAISAAMLWYVQASVDERLAYETAIRKIEMGAAEIDDHPVRPLLTDAVFAADPQWAALRDQVAECREILGRLMPSAADEAAAEELDRAARRCGKESVRKR